MIRSVLALTPGTRLGVCEITAQIQRAGYYTAQIGKWHLGSDPTGFDHWEILPGQGAYNDPIFCTATGEGTFKGGYATHVITDLGRTAIPVIEALRTRGEMYRRARER